MTPVTPELQRLEVLRAFKRRMPRREPAENISPFDERVSTAHAGIAGLDLPQIHEEVRQRIEHTITLVRGGERKSQVVLLAGDSGTGKTHLLRAFQSPELAERLGYVCVGGPYAWSVTEFHARLLDWTIEALTAPSPSEDRHLLFERVAAIGFRAVDHLLANSAAWQQCLAHRGGRWFGRVLKRLSAPSHDTLQKLVNARDPAVFGLLDFTRFSGYVCDRFLANKSNPTHRYALRVLLTYLFPDPHSTGVGARERVLHWFRGRGDDDYFARRLGAREKLDRQFSLSEAVRLLLHLFSPVVSRELATEKAPCPSRVFLLVFDQAEGQNELFNGDADWLDFFAHLSEVYNTMPNVVVLFTMTLLLRNRLRNLMERQFRDRIRMDEQFVLRFPTTTQILDLYRSRVDYWVRSDPSLLEKYRALENPYLPFDSARALEIAGSQTVRDTLEAFDQAFHEVMRDLVVEPEFDFHFYLNELRPQESLRGDFEYTADHLGTIRKLLEVAGDWLPADYGVTIAQMTEVDDDGPSTLSLRFVHPFNEKEWVVAYIVRLGFQFQGKLAPAMKRLDYKQHARYCMYLVRARDFELPEGHEGQVFKEIVPPAPESRLQGLLHLIGRKAAYEEQQLWPAVQDFVRREFANSYLSKIFREARRRLDALQASPSSDQPDASGEPASANP